VGKPSKQYIGPNIAPKSTDESRVHYAPEPELGVNFMCIWATRLQRICLLSH